MKATAPSGQRSVQDPVLGSVNGTTSFVYAFGSTDSFGYHGSSRGVVALARPGADTESVIWVPVPHTVVAHKSGGATPCPLLRSARGRHKLGMV